jgi:hypothetical protein
VDPFQLWNTFDTLDPDVLIAFPTLGNDSHAGQICTCVMLLRLERMRDPDILFLPSSLLPKHDDWLSEPMKAAKEDGLPDIFGDPKVRMPFDPLDFLFGDQGVFHVIWLYRPYLFEHLSLRWDITACRESYGLRLGKYTPKGSGSPSEKEDVTEEQQLGEQSWAKLAGEQLLMPGILHLCVPSKPSLSQHPR